MKTRNLAAYGISAASAMVLLPVPQTAQTRGAEAERPNILWLTFEDTSPYEFGCYGNRHATTPVIDSLAANGIQFMNAYSCGPQSSPARSTLITGAYSTTYGMDWHRGRVDTPTDIFFPQYLRNAGYYCTNNKKTDYNTSVNNKICWDECGDEATYNSPSRKDGQPFFAVFNSGLTHMSRLTSVHLDGRRDFAAEGLTPDSLNLPPHVPDFPEVRSDYAFHIEGCNQVDQWVKIFLDDLDKRGLKENTIIFVFSDHGGCLPRGKAFTYESSFRVPMVAFLPQKWQHLSKMPMGEQCDRLVSFADMGPTMLSLAGVEIPEYMQGIPFMGKADKKEREYQIAYMTNRTIHYIPSRTISDGRYKYIRYYIPYRKDALFNYFQWQMPANLAWDKAYQENKLSGAHLFPYENRLTESFYDLENDPFELNDLIADDRYAEQIEKMRAELSRHIRGTKDIGLLHFNSRKDGCPYDRVREEGYDSEMFYDLVELPLNVQAKDIRYLVDVLEGDKESEYKYWATVSLASLADKGVKLGRKAQSALESMLAYGDSQIAQEAAYALCLTDAKATAFNYLAQHPELTSTLEILALDERFKDGFPENVMDMLYAESARFEAKARDKMPGQGDGICARKVLVNLGLIPADQLYGPNVYKVGLKVNKTKRPLDPKP